MIHQSDGYNDALSHNNISVMKEMMLANIHQQESLSKMMEQYDSQRLTCIDKYIGWFCIWDVKFSVPMFANIFAR